MVESKEVDRAYHESVVHSVSWGKTISIVLLYTKSYMDLKVLSDICDASSEILAIDGKPYYDS